MNVAIHDIENSLSHINGLDKKEGFTNDDVWGGIVANVLGFLQNKVGGLRRIIMVAEKTNGFKGGASWTR